MLHLAWNDSDINLFAMNQREQQKLISLSKSLYIVVSRPAYYLLEKHFKEYVTIKEDYSPCMNKSDW